MQRGVVPGTSGADALHKMPRREIPAAERDAGVCHGVEEHPLYLLLLIVCLLENLPKKILCSFKFRAELFLPQFTIYGNLKMINQTNPKLNRAAQSATGRPTNYKHSHT